MFILDTNVISELRKALKGHPSVKAWADAQSFQMLHLSAVTVLEIGRGIYTLEQRGDKAQAAIFSTWLHQVILPRFEGRILPVTHEIAVRCAFIPWADPKDYRDALIAATALEHGATVVTRNIKDFEGTGVKLLNPWTTNT